MTRSKTILAGLGASSLLVAVTVAALGVGAASAAKAPPVAGTGTVSCTGAAGLAKFSPALSSTGTATSDVASFKVNLNGCSVSGTTNVTTANFTGHASGKLTASSNSCAALAGTQAVTGNLTISWTGKAGTAKLTNTVVAVTSLTGVPAGSINGNPGFTFSAQSASGSFAGSVSGELDSAQTITALGAKCSSGSLSKITINAGKVSQP